MSCNKGASLAKASNDIENSRRQTCLSEKFPKHEGSKGSLFGWFEDDRAASSEGRGHLPSHHQQGVVPGDYLAHHPHWLFYCHSEVRLHHLQGAALDLVGLARKVPVNVCSKGDVLGQADRNGLPIVQSLVVCQPFRIFLNQVGNSIQNPPLLVSVSVFPTCFQGLSGGLN